MMALIEGIAQLRCRQQSASTGRPSRWWLAWRLQLASLVLITLLFNATFVDTPLNPRFYQAKWGETIGRSPAKYGVTARDAFKERWLAEVVPPRAAVAADSPIATHLVNRPALYLTDDFENPIRLLSALLPELDYVLIDTLPDLVGAGRVRFLRETVALLLDEPDYQLTAGQDGLLLFGRAGTGLRQAVERLPAAPDRPLLASFDDQIGLRDATAQSLGNGRYLLQFDWIALPGLRDERPLVAVSQFVGVAHSRVVHLPTLALASTTRWREGELIREQFELVVPPDVPAGRYRLQVSWYDTTDNTFPLTDETSRVGQHPFILTLPPTE